MIKLEKEFLILIRNEDEYKKIKLILYTYGIKEHVDKSFKNYLSTNYYLRIFNNSIYQGSRYEKLRDHKLKIKQILTYDDFVNL